MLSQSLKKEGCDVLHVKGDADLLIVQTTIASSARFETLLVDDDTDLLILLCHHSKNTQHDIFKPEQKAHVNFPRCWNIQKTKSILDEVVRNNLPFVHVILGCDTTSRVFGIGKKVSP